MGTCLSAEELQDQLAQLASWELSDHNSITKHFKLSDFKTAIAFVNRVAEAAETQNHHPDIHIHYNRVLLELSTHEAAGVTDRDLRLAKTIDALSIAFLNQS